MVSIAAGGGGRPARPAKVSGQRRAAGIYGAIITAAMIAASGTELPTAALVTAVVITLLVYWVAEEYAEQAEGGRLPTWDSIRGLLTATWPMVTASYLPLVALVLARLADASVLTAVNVGLGLAILELTFHGWSAGRAAQLRGRKLLFATSVAAALGIVMVLLKDLVLLHLH